MHPTQAAAAAAPLLIELARAVRAWRLLDEDHPTRQASLRKAAAVWKAGLAATGPLELEVTERGFALGGTTPVLGPALEELAHSFRLHRVIGVQVHPDLGDRELDRLVEGLAGERVAVHDLVGWLHEADVVHIALWLLPEPAAQSAADPEKGAPTGRADTTVELVHALAELEPLDHLPAYKETSDRVSMLAEKLLAQHNDVDAYRALLVYGRHVTDLEGRAPEIRAEALSRLRALFAREDMRASLLERAYAPRGSSSVQAIQLLASLTPESAKCVLDEYARRAGERSKQSARILVALGTPALPVIANELTSPIAGRVRQAVRLLGDMQNPRAVEMLADCIGHRDSRVRREVVRALASIGNPPAVRVLADAMSSQGDVARFAAQALGDLKTPESVRELIAVAQDGTARSPELRCEAIRNLGRSGASSALAVLRQILGQSSWLGRAKRRPLRVAAAEAIGRIGGAQALRVLRSHARKGDAEVREACHEILGQLERDAEDQRLP